MFRTPNPSRRPCKRKTNSAVALLGVMVLSGAMLQGAIPAFPGAAGGGTKAVGGRGGAVIYVTNLNNSGSGSLRACLEASGARNCLFKVSGIINLSSPISITKPFVTVWGQSAPGGGIEVTGFDTAQNMIQIYTHDVVFRYLRLRAGYNAGRVPSPAGGVPMKVGNANDVYNLVIDHCSLTWSSDKQYTAWTNDSGVSVHDTTISWSILGQGVKGHSTAINIGSETPAVANAMANQDFHHNLIAHHDHRNPLFKGKSSRFVNNIVYNWGYYASMACGGAEVDFIGNYYKPGTMTGSGGVHEILIGSQADTATGSVSMYVAGNMGPHNSNPAANNWNMVGHISVCEEASEDGGSLSDHQRSSPLPAPATGYAIPVDDVAAVRDRLVDTVGPYQRIDDNGNWVPNRDYVDTYLVNDYRNGTGRDLDYSPAINRLLTDNPPASGSPCSDSDGDGISNVWETAHGLNPNSAADGASDSGNGYTWLEVFLNGGAGGSTPPPAPTATLSASVTTANPGQAIAVTWTATNPSASDTIAIYAQGASTPAWSRSTGAATSGAWTVTLPTGLGLWEYRYLAGGTTIIARSAVITIVAPPPTEPPPPSSFTPIRVNAGGAAFTDSKGKAWAADTGFAGGYPYSTTSAISNTVDDALYQSEHYNMSAYQFAVPNGSYAVNLKFAEIYFTSPGQRVFDVAINGNTVLPDFDVVDASGGRYVAIDKNFTANVTNGQIAIQFNPKVQNAKVSAIEILQTPTTGVDPIRVNAGGGIVTDSKGQVWVADAFYTGGWPFSTTSAIDNTTDDALYQTEHYGSSTSPMQYQFSLPNGSYRVNLKFAEIYHTATGKRVFNVAINGQTVLASFDVFAAAGARYKAVDKGFDVNVTNGQLTVQFGRITDNPKINAIEILSR
jgi:pectate lyase